MWSMDNWIVNSRSPTIYCSRLGFHFVEECQCVEFIHNIHEFIISFQNAKRDEAAKKAYKLLATLHTECADLIQMVQDTGIVQREIRDLEDQIEIERDRNITANLEQITNDLRILNGEADDIQQRINAHVATS